MQSGCFGNDNDDVIIPSLPSFSSRRNWTQTQSLVSTVWNSRVNPALTFNVHKGLENGNSV